MAALCYCGACLLYSVYSLHVIMVIMPGCVPTTGHCRSLAGEYRLPATHAVRRQAAVPDTKARTTTAAKSAFRSGASEERVASCTPAQGT